MNSETKGTKAADVRNLFHFMPNKFGNTLGRSFTSRVAEAYRPSVGDHLLEAFLLGVGLLLARLGVRLNE
jgi:hypothetical protein